MTLDEIDCKILQSLQRDTTQSLDSLSEHVNLSRNACWRRIKILDDAGVIAKRVALLNPDELDLGLSVFIQIRAGRHHADWLDHLKSAVKDIPEITGAYRMSGDLDYLLRARVRDVQAYDSLYQRLIKRIDLGDVSASFVMEELKETTELPL